MPRNKIVMSNSKDSPTIALPAYDSLDGMLRLSFLMAHTVGDSRFSHKRNRPNFLVRVYLKFARHF